MQKTLQQVIYSVAEFHRLLSELDKFKDGFTINADFTETPQAGLCVAVAATQGNFGPIGALKSFAFAAEHSLHFGGWLDPQTYRFYFDAVRLFPETELLAALKFAAANDQLSVFRLSDFTTFNLPENYPTDDREILLGFAKNNDTFEVPGKYAYKFAGGYRTRSWDNKIPLYWREKEKEKEPITPPENGQTVIVGFKPVERVFERIAVYNSGEYKFVADGNTVKAEQVMYWKQIEVKPVEDDDKGEDVDFYGGHAGDWDEDDCHEDA